MPPMNRQIFLSSNEIRNRFINFFKFKNHLQIKSSSVSPFADSTLEFVNAGMNQFKSVFLGLTEPPVKRAVNSQKCIRVGGKHNDLNMVGHDSYHHTFFEMLGNWSFGDYFKEEACSYALELITSPPYSLPVDRLYFTYFNGDKALNLPPDVETKQIWHRLGINEDRIIGFGLKENFWEMGLTGPCGPCTEIHFDHIGSDLRPHLVNKDLPDLTELWNLVFIQFQRQEDGSLSELSKSYVDTGMGFERLVALLQGKMSNYDSDLFTPLFETISENAKIPRYRGRYGEYDIDKTDTNYRILADHARMIVVALSDYILPDYSHSLRRVIRKSLLIAEQLSPNYGLMLLLKVIDTAAKLLGDHFPQVISNMNKVEMILKDEEKLFSDVRRDTENEWKKLLDQNNKLESLTDCQSIGLIQAYKYLKNNTELQPKLLNIDHAITCYDRYGLNLMLIEQLANIKGYIIDKEAFYKAVGKLKEMNKVLLSKTVKEFTCMDMSGLNLTNDKFKFSYDRDEATGSYILQNLNTTVLKAWIVKGDQPVPYGQEIDLLLDSTNFLSPLKGYGKPVGEIILTSSSGEKRQFTVFEVIQHYGYTIHRGRFTENRNGEPSLYENWNASCSPYSEIIEAAVRNTSAAILLNIIMKSKYGAVMTHLSVSSDFFTTKFNLYGHQTKIQDAVSCENEVNNIIMSEQDLITEVITSKQLLSDPTLVLPPYLNPSLEHYQLVSLGASSQSCAVTSSPNVLNTKDIHQLCLTQFNSGKRNRECTISGRTGASIKNNLSESASELVVTLKSSTLEVNKNELMKKLKLHTLRNLIPLEFHNDLKKLSREIKSTSKV